MFSSSGLLPATRPVGLRKVHLRKMKKGTSIMGRRKKVAAQKLTECIGKAMSLGPRLYHEESPSDHISQQYGFACSSRCKHSIHREDRRSSSRGKSSDYFIPEHLYKKYTETDSRPLTPDLIRRSVSVPRGKSFSEDRRRCMTPEPEARPCEFHHRKVLVLDLRRVKSVDVIGREGSHTPGTSVDSAGDDTDALFQFSPRHLSISRSITPKAKRKGGVGKKKIKDKPTSPIEKSNAKTLEGVSNKKGFMN